MAPQVDEIKAVVSASAVSVTPEDSASSDGKKPEGSYWDAPVESTLEGKTLSTMDMSMLEHQEAGGAEEQTTKDQGPKTGESYWDWKEGLRKTLSKLTLTDLFQQNGSNDDANGQQEPANWMQRDASRNDLKDGTTSTTNADDTTPSTADATENKARPSYWFWRNASLKNLSTASLTSLENAARASDTTQDGTKNDEAEAKPAGVGYWFWRNPSMSNIAKADGDGGGGGGGNTDSNASLETFEKTARESDRMEGKAAPGPISNLSHKLRTSWRKSFQKLSSNSLTKLDEGAGESLTRKSKQDWKDEFAGKKTADDDLSIHEEEGDEGAITF